MNQPRCIVSDTGPLISLEKLKDGHDFIGHLYDQIIVPQTVMNEVIRGQFHSVETYLKHYSIEDLITLREPAVYAMLPELERLHDGERQRIKLNELRQGGRINRKIHTVLMKSLDDED